MFIASLPRMLWSETDGWRDVARMHPSVRKTLFSFVVPLSLVPAVLYVYAELVHPGSVFPRVGQPLSLREAGVVGGVFFLAEVAMVGLMAVFIQRVAESLDVAVSHENAFAFAAIAPVPLWVSSLALLVPSVWANVAAVAVAWFACVALIRHGVRPLLGVREAQKARRMANIVTFIGVAAAAVLTLVFGFVLSLVLGLR